MWRWRIFPLLHRLVSGFSTSHHQANGSARARPPNGQSAENQAFALIRGAAYVTSATELSTDACVRHLPIIMIGLMEEPKPTSNVVRYRLTREVALRRVRDIAQNSENLRWSGHIRQRMMERGIDTDAVLRVLRQGYIDSDPIEGSGANEWKIKLTRRMPNGRVAGVVTILIQDNFLRLVTAEWEDVR